MTDQGVSGKPIAIVLAVVLIVAAVYKWWPSDERAIRRQLDALADSLTVPSTDDETVREARLDELVGYFAPDAHIRFAGQDLSSRDALRTFAEQWRPAPGGVFVEFPSIAITFGAGRTAAISVTVKSTWGPTSVVDTRGAIVRMAAPEGDWLVTSVEDAPLTTADSPGAASPR